MTAPKCHLCGEAYEAGAKAALCASCYIVREKLAVSMAHDFWSFAVEMQSRIERNSDAKPSERDVEHLAAGAIVEVSELLTIALNQAPTGPEDLIALKRAMCGCAQADCPECSP